MQRRSGFTIMKRLIVELKPLAPVMAITITMGVLGFLAAIAIMSFGAVAIGTLIGEITFVSFSGTLWIMGICAVLRGFLRYAEQLSGHYIAFKILAILRDKMFAALRRLAPAKLEGREKGDLIAMVTSDVELLEVFYAHTIAPIGIAVITNMIITGILYSIHPYFGIVGGVFFVLVGLVLPYTASIYGKEAGVQYRETFAKTNSFILDSLRGLKEILLFKNGEKRLRAVNESSQELNVSQERLKGHEGLIRAFADLTVMLGLLTFVGLGSSLYTQGIIGFGEYLIAVVMLASSFGPVVALSNLSNNLLQTFACAERLFNLLDELPQVIEVEGEREIQSHQINYDKVSFSYPNRQEQLLQGVSLTIQKGDKIALIGESGIGKSTFVKLLMRFWDVTSGEITLDDEAIQTVPTKSLRKVQTLVSQETYLFNETIEQNIKLGRQDATREQVIRAAQKASIHEFIQTLPQGYDTKVGELGGNVSSGEKQRIGLARAFLRQSEVLILDEPTSNLDTLSEGEILKAIRENSQEQTIVLISHRKSTTAICEKTYKIEGKNIILDH
ncbi:MAG: thiol reductant ABC exporter subunit CydC [Cellulosilyticaceae bacterium]